MVNLTEDLKAKLVAGLIFGSLGVFAVSCKNKQDEVFATCVRQQVNSEPTYVELEEARIFCINQRRLDHNKLKYGIGE